MRRSSGQYHAACSLPVKINRIVPGKSAFAHMAHVDVLHQYLRAAVKPYVVDGMTSQVGEIFDTAIRITTPRLVITMSSSASLTALTSMRLTSRRPEVRRSALVQTMWLASVTSAVLGSSPGSSTPRAVQTQPNGTTPAWG